MKSNFAQNSEQTTTHYRLANPQTKANGKVDNTEARNPQT